jgi:hypothetical protein
VKKQASTGRLTSGLRDKALMVIWVSSYAVILWLFRWLQSFEKQGKPSA